MTVKVSKLVKITTFESDDCVLSVGSQSATVANFDKNNIIGIYVRTKRNLGCIRRELFSGKF